MASVLENAYLRHRLRQMDQLYPEPTTFAHCDCTSYSYFALSLVLFVVGTLITVLALGDGNYIFSNLGHMWLVGPIFICSGLMIAVKSVLYLRRKSVIQMLLRQRALLRALTSVSDFHGVVGDAGKVLPPCYKEGPWSPSEMRSFKWLKQFISEGLQELAQQSRNQQTGCIMRNPSTATLPPTYEALMGASGSRGAGGGAGEIPPPSYEEAMFLIGDDKLQVVLEDSKYTASSDDELSKELCAGATGRKPQQGSTAD